MSEKFILSRRVMYLLKERLEKDLWYSQEKQNMYESDCLSYGVYQNAIDEDKKLIEELDAKLKIETVSNDITDMNNPYSPYRQTLEIQNQDILGN